MREVKFQVWDAEFQKMFSWEELLEMKIELGSFFSNEQVIRRQCISTEDMCGNEIYLGDIVKREFEIHKTAWEGSIEGNDLAPCEEFECAGYFIGVVSQTPQGLYVLNKCSKYDEDGNFVKKRSNVKLYAHRAEVIGNVYQNPELLGVQPNEV